MKLYGVELDCFYRDEFCGKCFIYLYVMAKDRIEARLKASEQFEKINLDEITDDEIIIGNIRNAIKNPETYKISEMVGGITHVIW